MSTLECSLQTFSIVNISGDNFRAHFCQFLGLGTVDVPRDRSGGESAVWIIQDCSDHASALRASRSQYRNNLFLRHDVLLAHPEHTTRTSCLRGSKLLRGEKIEGRGLYLEPAGLEC
jgi:hypothetical protein